MNTVIKDILFEEELARLENATMIVSWNNYRKYWQFAIWDQSSIAKVPTLIMEKGHVTGRYYMKQALWHTKFSDPSFQGTKKRAESTARKYGVKKMMIQNKKYGIDHLETKDYPTPPSNF
jgi:hypothetical protein